MHKRFSELCRKEMGIASIRSGAAAFKLRFQESNCAFTHIQGKL